MIEVPEEERQANSINFQKKRNSITTAQEGTRWVVNTAWTVLGQSGQMNFCFPFMVTIKTRKGFGEMSKPYCLYFDCINSRRNTLLCEQMKTWA